VSGEPRPDADIAPDPRRIAEGWERRFVAEGARVAEMVALYRSLGYETAADPVRPDDLGADCDDCCLAVALRLTTIYTRRSRAGTSGERP
jgi:hypothetical protein